MQITSRVSTLWSVYVNDRKTPESTWTKRSEARDRKNALRNSFDSVRILKVPLGEPTEDTHS